MGQETTRLDDDRDRLVAETEDATTADDPDMIEHDIEQTRAEMSETIDAIQDRLSPERLKAQAKEAAHDATIGRVVDAKDQAVEKVQDLAAQATDKVRSLTGGGSEPRHSSHDMPATRASGNSIVDSIRANPVPAAMVGTGVGWLLMRRKNHEHERSTYMRNTPTTRGYYRGDQMDYRTGYTDWDRQQPDPGHLRSYEGDTFKSQVTSTGSDLFGMIQRNPIPAALAGVGLGWFLMRRSGSGDHGDQPYYYRPGERSTTAGGYGYQGYDTQGYGYGYTTQHDADSGQSRVGEIAGSVQETAGDAMHRAQDTAGDAIHRAQDVGSQATERISQFGSTAQDQMRELPHQAQHQFQQMRGTLDQRMHESPLMMGVVAMGLGLAVGMLLPETQKENQVFGEKRDELMDRAQDMAGQAIDRAKEVATDAAQAAQESVAEATQQQDTLGSQSTATTS